MADKTKTLIVQTPEGVTFSLSLAGPVTRCLAWVLDLFIANFILLLAYFAFVFIGLINAEITGAIFILVNFIITIGYGIFCEWYLRGQTLGKRVFKLRVMDEQGLRLKFSQVVIRNLLRPVDGIPLAYLLGGLACLISKKSQRLGDLAAGTIVVRHPTIFQPDLDQLMAGKYNSFRDYPHLEARLRQRATPQEAGIALRALLRRDVLDPAPRVELFRDLADHFKSLVPFPPEAVEGIPDEQYLRNVVDALYRSSTKKLHD